MDLLLDGFMHNSNIWMKTSLKDNRIATCSAKIYTIFGKHTNPSLQGAPWTRKSSLVTLNLSLSYAGLEISSGLSAESSAISKSSDKVLYHTSVLLSHCQGPQKSQSAKGKKASGDGKGTLTRIFKMVKINKSHCFLCFFMLIFFARNANRKLFSLIPLRALSSSLPQ